MTSLSLGLGPPGEEGVWMGEPRLAGPGGSPAVVTDRAGGLVKRQVFLGFTPPPEVKGKGCQGEPPLPQWFTWSKNYTWILKAKDAHITCFPESLLCACGDACLQKFCRGKGNQPG